MTYFEEISRLKRGKNGTKYIKSLFKDKYYWFES